jgi:hypothetical protein
VQAHSIVLGLAVLVASAPALAADKAHHHGAASLQITIEGRTLQIVLESPADNILGFEHAPKNEAQKKSAAHAQQQLQETTRLFTPPPAAECQAQPAQVEIKLPASGSDERHSEIEAAWRWECAKPAALDHIDVGLFKAFRRLRELRAQIINAQGQRAVTLKPNSARLKLTS